MRRAPAPKPKSRRRRTEEARGGFKLAAAKIMGRVARYIAPPQDTSDANLWDAMTWQHFWGEHFWAETADPPGDFSACERPEAYQENPDFSPEL